MNQINKGDCTEVGYIQKPHGLNGGLILVFDKEFEESLEEIDLVLVEVDGGLVPFFIKDERLIFRTDESAVCKLEFVDSLTKAKELIGCKVYIFNYEIIDSEDHGTDSALIGMRAYDAEFGDIGLISRVDDFSGNLVITVEHLRAEILIPLSDGIITSIDDENREIHLNCPNGLINIYLN
jgi:16S rRNA processing protein RimM